MVKSKTHNHPQPRGKRGDGRKKALKEKQPPARDHKRERGRDPKKESPRERS